MRRIGGSPQRDRVAVDLLYTSASSSAVRAERGGPGGAPRGQRLAAALVPGVQQGVHQRLPDLRARVDAERGQAQVERRDRRGRGVHLRHGVQRPLRRQRPLLLCDGRLLLRDGGLPLGDVPLGVRAVVLDARDHQQQREQGDDGAADPQRAAVLARVLAVDLLLGPAVQAGGERGDVVAEPAVPQREVARVVAVGPAEVHPERLVREPAAQVRGQRVGGRPVEVTGRVVPADDAVGQRDQERLPFAVLLPEPDLPAHPRRLGRVGG